MIKDMAEVYATEDFGWWCDYTPMIESFGAVLVRKDGGSYQGDTWVLLQENDGRIGYLEFGWGSCSGCDALQACRSIEDVNELANRFYDSIRWFPNKTECAKWFKTYDFEGNWCWHDEDFRDFHRDVLTYLSA